MGKNPLFPLLSFPLSPPPRPERLLCLPFSDLAAQPAWPPRPWLARATPPSLLGWLARLGCTPYPRVFLFLILFTFLQKKYSKKFIYRSVLLAPWAGAPGGMAPWSMEPGSPAPPPRAPGALALRPGEPEPRCKKIEKKITSRSRSKKNVCRPLAP